MFESFGINQPLRNVPNSERLSRSTVAKRSEFGTFESVDLAETTFRELINQVFEIKCCYC